MAAGEVDKTAGGIVRDGSRIVLVYKTGGIKDGWVIPKGHINPGETSEEAAVREVGEETGLRVAIVRYLGMISRLSLHPDLEGTEIQIDEYLLRKLEGHYEGESDPWETKISGWFEFDNAIKVMRHPKEIAFLQEYHDTIFADE